MSPTTLLFWFVLVVTVALLTLAWGRRGLAPRWAGMAILPLAVVFALVEPHMPSSTAWSELALVPFAAPALVCGLVLVRAAALGTFAKGWHTAGLLVLGLVGFTSVFQALSYREDYAARLTWSCDGVLVERMTSTDGKEIRTLVVKQDDGAELHFVGVAHELWDEVKIGQRLTKRAGVPVIDVDGKPQTMFRRGRSF